MGELFGALGLAWPRIFFYPGGLFALGAGWLLGRWLAWCRRSVPTASPQTWQPVPILALVPPLTVMSLLPLAPARPFPYGLDLFVALMLLEWPRMLSVGTQPWAPTTLVRGYGPLLVATLGMTEAVGGSGLSQLLAWPSTERAQALLMLSAALWLSGLPHVLQVAPAGLAGRLRALGLVLIATLPLLAALAYSLAPYLPTEGASVIVPLLGLGCVVLLLGAMLRLPSRWLERLQLGLGLLVLGLGGAGVLLP